MSDQQVQSKPNECCNDDANLVEIGRTAVVYPDGSDAGELIIQRCQVCGCRHFTHLVKPFSVGLTP